MFFGSQKKPLRQENESFHIRSSDSYGVQEPTVTYHAPRIAQPQPYVPPPPPPKYPHRHYHPGLPHHLRDEHYLDPYLVWGSVGGVAIDDHGKTEYPLQDAWYMYPTGPWKVHWSGHVPNRNDRLHISEATTRPYSHRTMHPMGTNTGVASNEQAFIQPEVFGQEYAPHDHGIRNVKWKRIGSMMPDGEHPSVEGKKRHLAMLIQEPRGMAPAVDIKGLAEHRFDYTAMAAERKEVALFPERRAKERELEVFDDEALAEFFADPEAMLERDFKLEMQM